MLLYYTTLFSFPGFPAHEFIFPQLLAEFKEKIADSQIVIYHSSNLSPIFFRGNGGPFGGIPGVSSRGPCLWAGNIVLK